MIDEAKLSSLLADQREAWQRQQPDYAQRMDDLKRLRTAFKARLPALLDAMDADFGRRSRHESLLADGMTVIDAIDHCRSRLDSWMRPRRIRVDTTFLLARAEVRARPLGVVGIMAPWNYPVNLALVPLVEALAAGNHVMLKPSEHVPRTAEVLRTLLGETFPEQRVATVLGDAQTAAAFSALPFDHLLFTGSTATGRKVMAAAARNLTPVTLELGGKSPAIIGVGADLGLAVPRIAAGKFLNAGQTCIAPDYVLLPAGDRQRFIAAMRAYVARHYPRLRDGADYSAIINADHYHRLQTLVDDAVNQGAQALVLPDADAHDPGRRVFAPTLLTGVTDTMRVAQEEIFGPLLPLIEVDDLDAAITYVNARPRPLALYHFDGDHERIEHVLRHIPAGSVAVNDCVLQFVQSRLPFGGIGASGIGQYHGHAGFLTFSKQLPVFRQSRWSAMALMRPPYGRLADTVLRILMR